jgi:hypothetical protein
MKHAVWLEEPRLLAEVSYAEIVDRRLRAPSRPGPVLVPEYSIRPMAPGMFGKPSPSGTKRTQSPSTGRRRASRRFAKASCSDLLVVDESGFTGQSVRYRPQARLGVSNVSTDREAVL